ncbi:alpha/beta fold hydrolase [Haloferax larsenii]|uniref:Alpha/beta fold hydrolase n=1 Tax=Haloferax larsenii TaxID=302484 RepID=A0ABY5RD41_HALLR|nr:alpha/beta fold hydrolase [Haloferax larsenii]UVE50262.1 alpha/beta fold hydrolase [Haloferax larsenii]
MVSTSTAEEMARQFSTAFLDESFVDAADLLTETGRSAVIDSFPDAFGDATMDSEEVFETYWWGLYSQYGTPAGVGELRLDDNDVAVVLEFEDGTETARLDIGTEGVENVQFSPEYEPPAYADESAFNERDVTIDAGDVDLDGVLAVPEGDGPFPAVVLVHGAGIHDPDGTAGASKILKDLAWGLASRGIATLRYEKRLADHEVADGNYTLDTVVVDDAVAAVDTLAAVDEVDERAVFLAGHSQGGMCGPRIADRHGDVAGVAALDARADSTQDPDDLTFLRYEFELDGDLSEDQVAELERERETVRRLAEGDYGDDEVLWGRPGTWHRSMRNYNPAGTASAVDIPTFVLKTCRADEEVQADLAAWFRDEFEKWQAVALADGSRVELYDGLDHFFQDGFAPTHPVSLFFGGNVAERVVSDLAEWVSEVAANTPNSAS